MTDSRPDTCKLLVIGYGSELRSDDVVGLKVAGAIEEMNLPGVRAIPCHQLTPELADAISRAQSVIFVDADATGATEVRMRPLAAAPSGTVDAHLSDPRSLLALARDLFGHCPSASLLAIPVEDFEIGDRISATAQRGIERAVEEIQALAFGR